MKNQIKPVTESQIDATKLKALASLLHVRTGLKGGKGKTITPCV